MNTYNAIKKNNTRVTYMVECNYIQLTLGCKQFLKQNIHTDDYHTDNIYRIDTSQSQITI